MTALRLADDDTRADLATYVSRARRLEEDGAIRLQASGIALATWVGVLRGRGVAGEGTTLGLRVLPLAEPADLDVVVPLASVADRMAKPDPQARLDVPPQRVVTSWAAISPPRSGWQKVGEVPVDSLHQIAQDGIAEIAAGAPAGSGAAAVESLRQQVWARGNPMPGAADGLPAGVAFAAYVLGFLAGDSAQLYAAARWHRLTTPAGHVLVR